MNPLKWIRWKVVIVLAVLFGGMYFFGLNPLARRQINELGAGGDLGARFKVDTVDLGLLEGRASFDRFLLGTPRGKTEEAKERVASADQIVCDLGMADLLSRRFAADELSITKPILSIQRRKDGTINVGEIGSKEPEKPSGKPTDWVKAVNEWMEKLKKRAEERRKKQGEGEKPEKAREKGLKADYTKVITYPFERIPRALVRKMSAQALEVRFEDETGAIKPPPIKNCKLEITNLSDRPEYSELPIGISLSGEIENAPIQITGTIDLRHLEAGGPPIEKNDLNLRITASNIPLQQVVQSFAGESLEATFDKGTVDVNAEVRLNDFLNLKVNPLASELPLFALRGVHLTPKPGSKIAGFDGAQFCNAVNEVGELEVKDLEIGGTLLQPEFKWGDSIKELVLSGGKAYAKKQAQKGIEKAQGALEKELEKNPQLKKALPGGVDAQKTLEQGAGGALDGLFGKKKTEEKK